jgi:hypothetical protein
MGSMTGPLIVDGAMVTPGGGGPGYPLNVGGRTWVVDNVLGSDAANQKGDFNEPLATIQEDIDRSNTTINWSYTPKFYNYIYVKPGVYAENLTPAYYCIIEGLGIRGTDTAAEIHPATGSAMTGTLLGSGFRNLRIEGNTVSTPIFDIGICNNSFVEDCEFALGANVAGVAAIDTDNATHFEVRNCDFTSGQLQNLAYAGYHRGGANKFAHNVRWLNNRIWAATAGIWIQDTCTASGFLAQGNMIWIDAAGKGIDCNYTGAALMVGNLITGGAGADAIEHSGGSTYTTFNQTNIAGTAAQETA